LGGRRATPCVRSSTSAGSPSTRARIQRRLAKANYSSSRTQSLRPIASSRFPACRGRVSRVAGTLRRAAEGWKLPTACTVPSAAMAH
jgi:hypothetical protein